MAHSLPCLLDFDGPTLYNYAWSGYIIPLDKYVTQEMKADFLPSIIRQGTYNHHLYSLGQLDSGLGIYANKHYLSEAGVRIPTINNPWTLNEFNTILAKLKNVPGVRYPLDLGMNYGYSDGEWFAYGFSPFLESFGGDLINRSNYQSASGVLNGSAAVAAMTWFQGLFKQGYSNPLPADYTDFISGRSALSWIGHWVYPAYSQALGDNLLVLPAPNLGTGAKTGMGSWNWGITSSCKTPDAAWQVLNFLMSPNAIARMSNANGAIPARKSVIAKSSFYAPNGPLDVFAPLSPKEDQGQQTQRTRPTMQTKPLTLNSASYSGAGLALGLPPTSPRGRLLHAGKRYVNGWIKAVSLHSALPPETMLRLCG